MKNLNKNFELDVLEKYVVFDGKGYQIFYKYKSFRKYLQYN